MTPIWDLAFLIWSIGCLAFSMLCDTFRWALFNAVLVVFWLLVIAGDLGLIHG